MRLVATIYSSSIIYTGTRTTVTIATITPCGV